MKIYTRTGDEGETGFFGGGRVPKAHVRVEAYGAVDELNASLGLAAASLADEELLDRITLIQKDLFSLGAALASPGREDGLPRPAIPPLPDSRIGEMEGWIDQASEELPALGSFILPGGSAGAAALHLARTVCRRAERRVVALLREESVDPTVLRYLNRLSDLLFVFARLANHRGGVADTPWRSDAPRRDRSPSRGGA